MSIKFLSVSVLFLLLVLNITDAHPSLGSALAGKTSIKKDHREPLDAKGHYKYDIELSDGTKLQQEGMTEPPGPGETEGSLVVKGSYSYISPDGTPVHVSYTADKDGFKPITDTQPKAR